MTDPSANASNLRHAGKVRAAHCCTLSRCLAVWLFGFLGFSCGCESAPRNYSAIRAYYNYDFTTAREAVRDDAYIQNEQVLLNNARLGVAALADGDNTEAEQALGRVFNWLSTAGLNEDRTTAAVWVHEGVRIWKGEPFEQALLYHYVATQYAVQDDWENARAAASNALFRLTDFGGDKSSEDLTRSAAEDDNFLDIEYTAVDTNFALGFVMQAIGSKLSGASGFDAQLNAAVAINEDLNALTDRIRSGFDTLLIVDYGKGPTKIAYGPDDALLRFDPQERHRGPITVNINGSHAAKLNPVCDIDRMAVDHRWNNLEDIRIAKSVIGDVLVVSGFAVAAHGGNRDSLETVLAGLGMMAAGALTKSGAKGDTRYFEFAPQSIYIVPLALGDVSDLELAIQGDVGSRVVLDNVRPGTAENPRTIYLRIHGADSPDPQWLTAITPYYTNDFNAPSAGALPYIGGGRDVSMPSRTLLQTYQAGGFPTEFTPGDLIDLYRVDEELFLGSGMDPANDIPRNSSYRHILETGRAIFTPQPYSMGYKRLMYQPHDPYEPRSERLRNIAARLRVRQDEP